ncbi:BTAD domain-containing putative transcriptional regulator [Streptomyces sp. NPDC006197]|uniref:AfsR/SARP family transcriptional regulator n=1 Tax=Streptomyces sp. NPDC006197 TaxID=3156685 RepID=UPI0033A56927
MDTAALPSYVRLLGPFRFECAAGAVSVTPNGQRLIAYLGLQCAASRTVVAGTLWPDVTEGHAQGSLRTTLWRLNRGHSPVVEARGDTLALSNGVQVDVHAFTRMALQLVNAPETFGEELPLDLFSCGDLLPGWGEEWVMFERERLHQLKMHAIETLSTLLASRGRYALALEAALTCVRMEPLRESAHRAVVTVHLAEGNAVEAYRHYETFRALIAEKMGMGPSEHFTALLPPRRQDSRGQHPLLGDGP